MNCVATDPLVGEACFKKMLSVLLEREIGKVSVSKPARYYGSGYQSSRDKDGR